MVSWRKVGGEMKLSKILTFSALMIMLILAYIKDDIRAMILMSVFAILIYIDINRAGK